MTDDDLHRDDKRPDLREGIKVFQKQNKKPTVCTSISPSHWQLVLLVAVSVASKDAVLDSRKPAKAESGEN